ncbi:MAG: hypothetical protein NTY19_01115 [Planctomycetota bacterium]|nr:hypothetical protein [Planctomycetota bacterium]
MSYDTDRPKQQNLLSFDWKGQPTQIRSMLMGDMNDGEGSSIQRLPSPVLARAKLTDFVSTPIN